MFNPFVISSALLCVCLTVLLNSSVSQSIFKPFDSCIRLPDFISHLQSPASLNYGSPHVSSWSSWFHPQSSINWRSQPGKKRNRLYNLGRTGPWVEMLDGVLPSEGGIGPPDGCSVDQVHMVDFPLLNFPFCIGSQYGRYNTSQFTLFYMLTCILLIQC